MTVKVNDQRERKKKIFRPGVDSYFRCPIHYKTYRKKYTLCWHIRRKHLGIYLSTDFSSQHDYTPREGDFQRRSAEYRSQLIQDRLNDPVLKWEFEAFNLVISSLRKGNADIPYLRSLFAQQFMYHFPELPNDETTVNAKFTELFGSAQQSIGAYPNSEQQSGNKEQIPTVGMGEDVNQVQILTEDIDDDVIIVEDDDVIIVEDEASSSKQDKEADSVGFGDSAKLMMGKLEDVERRLGFIDRKSEYMQDVFKGMEETFERMQRMCEREKEFFQNFLTATTSTKWSAEVEEIITNFESLTQTANTETAEGVIGSADRVIDLTSEDEEEF